MALRFDFAPMHLILSQLFVAGDSLRRSEGGSFMLMMATSTSPSLSKSPKAIPRLGRGCRSEEHTSELQSLTNLVCRLLLEKKKQRLQYKVHDYLTKRSQCEASDLQTM